MRCRVRDHLEVREALRGLGVGGWGKEVEGRVIGLRGSSGGAVRVKVSGLR